MKTKLRYAKEADEFIFVLLFNAMEFYRKQKKFSNKNLFVWLLDLKNRVFTEKNTFNKIFNVE